MVRGASRFGGHHCAIFKIARPRSCRHRRPSLIYRRAELRICARRLHMLGLRGYRWNMPLSLGSFLLRSRSRVDASLAAVITHAIYHSLVNHCRVIDIVNVCDVDVINRAIVEKPSIFPSSAFVAFTEVPKSIGYATVEAHLRPPIASMENKRSTAPSPIPRSPQKAGLWSEYPRARNPEVILGVVIPVPISGGPDIALTWTQRLLVYGESRRPKGNCNSELPERGY